jgi:hypothetical protein
MYRDKGLTIEIRAVGLIRVERALPLVSLPATIGVRQKGWSKIDGAAYWRKV